MKHGLISNFLTKWHRSSGSVANFCGTSKLTSRVVDLRTDTLTKLQPAVLTALQTKASSGTINEHKDPTVEELEKRFADMFGMESALFLPTRTIANFVAILAHHHNDHNRDVIVGIQQHIGRNASGQFGFFAFDSRVNIFHVANADNGTIPLKSLQEFLQNAKKFNVTIDLICLENTHNLSGGRVLPLDYLKEIYDFAQIQDANIHVDGARLINASVALGVSVKDILKYADSASLCLSKALGAPFGAIIGGTREFIEMASEIQKTCGGSWAKAGIMAAAGLAALNKCEERIATDHKNAKLLAQGINDLKSPLVKINLESVETNVVVVETTDETKAEKLCRLLKEISPSENKDVSVLCLPFSKQKIRFVTHNDVSTEDINSVIKKMNRIVDKLYKI